MRDGDIIVKGGTVTSRGSLFFLVIWEDNYRLLYMGDQITAKESYLRSEMGYLGRGDKGDVKRGEE